LFEEGKNLDIDIGTYEPDCDFARFMFNHEHRILSKSLSTSS